MLDDWAREFGIPAAALHALRVRMGIAGSALLVSGTPGSESRQQSLVRLHAAQRGVWLTRNNVGALLDDRGVPVRFGLANESKEQNKVVKSGDLIGMRIGTGQFVSREIKHEGWTYKGDAHEQAQLRWIQFVLSKGGDAAFCTGPLDANL